ncbi:hypothetical protein KI387_013828, partial [Taxus chinensis]
NSITDGLDTERVQALVSSSTSPRHSLSSRTSLGKDEGAEEAEIASFTDDDECHSFHSLSSISTSASEAKLNSPSTKLEHSLGVEEVEKEPGAVDINSESVQKAPASSAEALPVKTASSSSSSKGVLSGYGLSADISSCSASPDNEDYLIQSASGTISPQSVFRNPIFPRINSPSQYYEHEGEKHTVTKITDGSKVPLEVNEEKNSVVGEYGGLGKDRKEPEVIETHDIKEDLDVQIEKEAAEIKDNTINKAFNIVAGNELPEVKKEERNKEGKHRRKRPDGHSQLEITTSSVYDGKNKCEADVLFSGIMTLAEEADIQAPVPESMVEEEALKQLPGGVQAVELSYDKVARQEKVSQKEGSHQTVDLWARLAKPTMEKPIGGKQTSKPSRDPPKKAIKVGMEVRNGGKNGPGVRVKSVQDGKPKNLKVPIKPISDSEDINPVTELDDKFIEEVKEINVSEIASSNNGNGAIEENDGKPIEIISKEENMKIIFAEARAAVADEKVKQMELELEKLEGELREAAAIEAAVYSVIAEHGGSLHKVHSPARRLARLYIHACKHWSQDRRAGAARNAASGLILVAKACGNDVPRLTFWWSNTVVLREIVSQSFDNSQLSPQVSCSKESNGVRKNQRLSSSQNSRCSLTKQGIEKLSPKKKLNDWEETQTFTTALEEIESWIYGRVIESVWWQTLTPYMQCPTEVAFKEHRRLYSRKSFEKLLGPELGNRQQGKFSIDLWKKAFLDAFQRLCPVRAGGHECGCLSVLAKMVLEQCVARLDVAMFNALLRESEEDMPADPISDPISDPSVLPIPAGNLCFGSGAQLKNAIGTWSRWLTDLVGIDAEDSNLEGSDPQEDNREDVEALLSSFPLLNAASDLLMLPKDMLMDKSIRKEVCPVLSLPLIKRILYKFVADEFCPDPVPLHLMETLNAEIPLELRLQSEEDSAFNSLVSAPSIEYSPPPASSIREKIGDTKHIHLGRSASAVLRKGYTSDDELDEIETPLSLLVETVPEISPQMDKMHSNGKPGGNAKHPTIKTGGSRRYQLLREAWA